MNADVGQVLGPHLALLPGEGDSAFTKGRFGTTSQPNSLGSIAIALPNSWIGYWRSIMERNRRRIVLSIVRLGEPRFFDEIASTIIIGKRYDADRNSLVGRTYISPTLDRAARKFEPSRYFGEKVRPMQADSLIGATSRPA